MYNLNVDDELKYVTRLHHAVKTACQETSKGYLIFVKFLYEIVIQPTLLNYIPFLRHFDWKVNYRCYQCHMSPRAVLAVIGTGYLIC